MFGCQGGIDIPSQRQVNNLYWKLSIPCAPIHDASATDKDQRKAFTHRFVIETCAAHCGDSRFHCFESVGFLTKGWHQRTHPEGRRGVSTTGGCLNAHLNSPFEERRTEL